MALAWWLPFLLLSLTSAELFPDPLAERGRALGAGPTAKNAIHRERLALYNLLDSPESVDIQDPEIRPISPYIPLQMESPQPGISSYTKELPFAPAVFAPGLQLFPINPIRAPYATAQFMPHVNHHQLYPHQPLTVYAPTYPYMYKSQNPEVS